MRLRSIIGAMVLSAMLLLINVSNAQIATAVNFIPEVRGAYSYISTQESLQPYVNSNYFPLFEFSLYRETFGLNRWEILYKYPRKGVLFFYSDMGGAPTGPAIGAAPFINFPLFREDKWSTSFRVGAGLAYFTKSFGFQDENNVILAESSKLNAAIVAGPQFSYTIKKFTLTGGLTLYHINNAGYKVPGYFFNIPSVFAGVSYVFGSGSVTPISEPLAKPRKKWRRVLWAGVGYKTVLQQSKSYFPYSGSLNISKFLSSKSRLGVTLDAFYDITIYQRKMVNAEKATPSLSFRSGAALNYTWVIGALEIPFDFGVYIFPAYASDGSFYNRIGMRYFLHKNFFINCTLKTHFFKPDHFEGGLGVAF